MPLRRATRASQPMMALFWAARSTDELAGGRARRPRRSTTSPIATDTREEADDPRQGRSRRGPSVTVGRRREPDGGSTWRTLVGVTPATFPRRGTLDPAGES